MQCIKFTASHYSANIGNYTLEILKLTFFKVSTLIPNNSRNIRAGKKVLEIICSSALSLFNDVICNSLLLKYTAAKVHKDVRKKLSRSTMM